MMKAYNSRWSSVKTSGTRIPEAAPYRPKSTALEDLPDPDGGGETMTDTTSSAPVTKLRQTKSAIWELSDNIPDEPDQATPNARPGVVHGKVREMVRLFDRNLRTADEETPDPAPANGSEGSGARAMPTNVGNGRPVTPSEVVPSPAPPVSLAASTSGRSSTAAGLEEEQEDPTETQSTKSPGKRSNLKSSSKGSLPRSTFHDRTIDQNDDQTMNTSYYDSTGCTRDSRRMERRPSSRSSSRQRQPSAEIKIRWDMSPPKRDGPISATTKPANYKYSRMTAINYRTSRTAANVRSPSRNRSSEELQELVDHNSNLQLFSKTSGSFERLSARNPKATRVEPNRIHDAPETENRDLAENLTDRGVTQEQEVVQNPVGWTARCYRLSYLVFHSMFMAVSIPASWIWNRIPTWMTRGLKQNDYPLEQSDTLSQTNP